MNGMALCFHHEKQFYRVVQLAWNHLLPKHSMKNNNFNERSVNKFELPLQFQSMLAKKEKSNELISEIKEENENKETKHLGIEIPVCGGDDDNNIFSADDN